MKKLILSLAWMGSVALSHAGQDMKDLTPVTAPSDKHAFNVFTGFGGRNSSWYSYAGTVFALNGDINSSGWYLRSQIGGGQYAYSTPAIQGRVRGSLFDADLGIGYKQYFGPDWSLQGFVGPHYRDRDLNIVDPGSNVTSSDKVGARTGLQFTGTPNSFYVSGIGQYSTVDNAVWSRLRLGYKITPEDVTVGPEGLYFGDKDFDEYRGGAFVKFPINDMIELSFSGGYTSFTSQGGNQGGTHNSNSSPYGDVGLSFSF
jgi:hypothetical protein